MTLYLVYSRAQERVRTLCSKVVYAKVEYVTLSNQSLVVGRGPPSAKGGARPTKPEVPLPILLYDLLTELPAK